MPPQLALLLCFAFIALAYRIDIKREPDVSAALWIPLLWILFVGSRPPSSWLFNLDVGVFPPDPSGNPLDAVIYSTLIAAGLHVLSRRQINWSEFVTANRSLIVLFVFMGLSVLWTDDPIVAAKRFIKMLGMPVMALVVLTEPNPLDAIQTLTRRCAYVLIPLSETLNKYFFSIAVAFDEWSGAISFNGAMQTKNMLGEVCFVLSLMLSWTILTRLRRGESRLGKQQLVLDALVLLLAIYLLIKSNSATSKVCLLTGVSILLCGNLRFVRWRIASLLVLAVVLLAFLEVTVGVRENMASALSRDATLTNRTDIWQELWGLRGNELVGTGYEAFWTGERLWNILQARHINEAHNGYLEIFLNLGAIGLLLWSLLIGAAYKNCKQLIRSDYDFGRIGMTLFSVVLIYNFTEAGFKGLSFILFFFFLIAIKLSRFQQAEPEVELEEVLEDRWMPASAHGPS